MTASSTSATTGTPSPSTEVRARVGRRRWLALAVVLAVEVMDLLDATVVGVASPSIRADFGGSSTQIQWIAAAYTLSFSVLMITGARLGDIVGRRRMFLVGIAGFGACSLLCAASGSAGMLIAMRAAQGVFAAMMVPQGLGLVREVFPPADLGAVFGIFGPVMGLSAITGPVLGGFLTDADLFGSGWRAVFLINVPVALAAFFVARRVLPESRAPHRPRLDLPGVAVLSAAVLLLVHPLVQGRDLGWPLWIFLMMAASLPVFALFVRHQRAVHRRGGSPLVEPGLFRDRGFTGSLAVGVLFFAGIAGLTLVLPLYLQYGLGFSATHAGLSMVPWALGSAIGATLSGAWLGKRYGRATLQGGLLLTAPAVASVALIAHLNGDPSSWQLAPSLLLCGTGLGLVMAPFFDIALAGVTDQATGSAAGVLNAAQQLGGSVGVAVLGTAFFARAGHGMGAALDVVLPATAVALLLTSVVAFLMPRRAAHPDAAH